MEHARGHARGQVHGINSQTPRRRMALFRGVCRFSPLFCYFLCVLFGRKEIFRIFAGGWVGIIIAHLLNINVKKP